jgi:hypothetical protein
MKKKKTKRGMTKYPNLNPELQLKTRFELYDQDYIDKLSEKEKAWLDKFMGEWANAALDVNNLNRNLHNTKELKKDCQDRNNARNRCILTRAKATGIIDYIEEKGLNEFSEDYEDALLTAIDLRKNFKNGSNSSGYKGDDTDDL